MGEKARPALTRKPGNLLRRNGEVSSAESSSSESAAGEKSVRIFPGFALPFWMAAFHEFGKRCFAAVR